MFKFEGRLYLGEIQGERSYVIGDFQLDLDEIDRVRV